MLKTSENLENLNFKPLDQTQHIKVIIDTDPGIDDLECITMLLKHTNVLALTTTYGNCSVATATNNACRILSFLERTEVPVYEGAAQPLNSCSVWDNGSGWHGRDGMGDTDLIPRDVAKKAESESAPNALLRLVNAHPGEITIVAIGPLTNLAITANLDPSIAAKLKALYIMGGSYNCGNETKFAEWNFHCDPLAADLVLRGYSPEQVIELITWDCCLVNGIHVTKYIEGLGLKNGVTNAGGIDVKSPVETVSGGSKSAGLMRTIALTSPWCDHPANMQGEMIFADQLVALLVLCPEAGVKSKRGSARVLLEGEQRGRMMVEWGGEGRVNVFTELDVERLVEVYKGTVA